MNKEHSLGHGSDNEKQASHTPRIWTILGKVALAILPGLLALFGAYYFFRPAAHPDFYCNPQEGEAPLTVTFVNESLYYSKVIWEFDDQSPNRFDTGRFEYVFSKPGEYRVTLTAIGKENRSKSLIVKVRNSISIPSAPRVRLVGMTRENRIIENKSFSVSFTKDDHPIVFGAHGRDYSNTFQPDSGFRFIDAQFSASSSNHASRPAINIASDGRSVSISSRLESGPQVDQWRGWLSGTLVAKQEKIDPQHDIVLAQDMQLDRFGQYFLPKAIDLSSLSAVSIIDTRDGTQIAAGNPAGVLIAQSQGLVFTLSNNANSLVLEVEKQ